MNHRLIFCRSLMRVYHITISLCIDGFFFISARFMLLLGMALVGVTIVLLHSIDSRRFSRKVSLVFY